MEEEGLALNDGTLELEGELLLEGVSLGVRDGIVECDGASDGALEGLSLG